ncbi:hypothetical protein AB0B50_40390 [Streptomyces sp. NPDC041068]|uniref:hypothetical protein n=1 Tax=Streptomyces sp. NPDC041068 TaxID=3155130 RepID=UPI0033D485E4
MARYPRDGVYLIRSDAGDLYVELTDGDIGPNVPLVGGPAHKGPSQQWELVAVEPEPDDTHTNTYTIKSKLGEVYAGQLASRLFPPRAGSRPTPLTWSIEYVDEGVVRILSPRSDQSFELERDGAVPEILLTRWKNAPTQRWILEQM